MRFDFICSEVCLYVVWARSSQTTIGRTNSKGEFGGLCLHVVMLKCKRVIKLSSHFQPVILKELSQDSDCEDLNELSID